MAPTVEAPQSERRDIAEAFGGKYLSLTSFKRDGTGVATPVWFVAENGHLLVETDADSYKVKRIRRDHRVTVAACNASGRPHGDGIPADAAMFPDEELPRVERLLHEKYRLDYIFVLPIYLLVQRLRGEPLRYEKPVVLSITPNLRHQARGSGPTRRCDGGVCSRSRSDMLTDAEGGPNVRSHRARRTLG